MHRSREMIFFVLAHRLNVVLALHRHHYESCDAHDQRQAGHQYPTLICFRRKQIMNLERVPVEH